MFSIVFFYAGKLAAQHDSVDRKSALSYQASYIGDAVNNLGGGLETGNCYLGMANLRLTLNTKKAGLWSGGEFFVNAANTHGGTPSDCLTGDFQVSSNIQAGEHTYLHELWYKQEFKKLTVIVGLQDLNAEFVSSQYASLFTNSSFGTHSTISSNLPIPIFPLTSVGLHFKYQFSDQITAKLAFFDGVPEGFVTNIHNTHWSFNKKEGVLTFSEITLNKSINDLEGSYRIGAYFHNSYCTEAEGENESESEGVCKKASNCGLYVAADQTLFKHKDGKSLSLFCQASISPQSINENWYYIGLGLNYTGLLSNRKEDILGLAMANAGLKNKADECTLELTYKAKITDNIFIQPDFQYVMNPSGCDTKLKNALLGTIRFGINF